MNTTDVRQAHALCRDFLLAQVGRDWTVPVPDLEWKVAEAISHMAATPFWYAMDLSAGHFQLNTIELEVNPETAPEGLISTLDTAVKVLCAVLDASSPEDRGHHGWGKPDHSGFAAMACDEMLIHTDDAARGLGLTFKPDAELCAKVLARLFHDMPRGVPPWDALRWANGRRALQGYPRRTTWRWYCSPLDEQ